jgi:CDGSH-type Zn-finger protein
MATTSKLMIDPTQNGPLHLQGQITIRNSYDQVIFEGVETWLCRCGHSANKPFCDGTHEKVGLKE